MNLWLAHAFSRRVGVSDLRHQLEDGEPTALILAPNARSLHGIRRFTRKSLTGRCHPGTQNPSVPGSRTAPEQASYMIMRRFSPRTAPEIPR